MQKTTEAYTLQRNWQKQLRDYCKEQGVTKGYMPDSFEHSRKKGGELSGVTKMIWKNTGDRKECTSTWKKKEVKLKNKKKRSVTIKYKIEAHGYGPQTKEIHRNSEDGLED